MDSKPIQFRIELEVVGFDPSERSRAASDIGEEMRMRPYLGRPNVIDDQEQNRVLIQAGIRDTTSHGAVAQITDQLYEIINVTVERIDSLKMNVLSVTPENTS
jgi:hypothetical protein